MSRKITIIDGHPDPNESRLCHHLSNTYAEAAQRNGLEVQVLRVAEIDFPLLRTADDFDNGTPVKSILESQEVVRWADHLVVIYPLWLGTMPALLKGFLEQVFRPTFAFEARTKAWPAPLLAGKSARIIVTMGMPAFFYRWFYLAHSLKSLERNILKFSGIRRIRETLIGALGNVSSERALRIFEDVRKLGHKGE